jgi:hypothetical protein
MQVRNKDEGHGAREIGDRTGIVVEPGQAVEVPDDLVGKAPTGTPGTDDYDPGYGLLAQTDVWELVEQQSQAQPPAEHGQEV